MCEDQDQIYLPVPTIALYVEDTLLVTIPENLITPKLVASKIITVLLWSQILWLLWG